MCIYIYMYVCMYVCIYIYIYIYMRLYKPGDDDSPPDGKRPVVLIYFHARPLIIVAIFYPFSQFCEIDISLLSLQKQPNTAPNLFQRGVEYGKYAYIANIFIFT